MIVFVVLLQLTRSLAQNKALDEDNGPGCETSLQCYQLNETLPVCINKTFVFYPSLTNAAFRCSKCFKDKDCEEYGQPCHNGMCRKGECSLVSLDTFHSFLFRSCGSCVFQSHCPSHHLFNWRLFGVALLAGCVLFRVVQKTTKDERGKRSVFA